MDTDGVIQLLIVFMLICFSAFFSSIETAFTSLSKIRIQSLFEDGNKAAGIALKIHENYRKMISAVLISNNIVNLAASALTTALVIEIWGNVAVGIATGILTLVIVLGAEILPKTLANLYAERYVLACAGIVLAVIRILTPVIFLVDRIAGLALKMMRIDTQHKEKMTETEIRTYVDESHKDGVIESEERTMIHNVFDFGDTKARDIMIPRINMVAISAEAGYGEFMTLFKEYMYTRFPVYREDKDVIIGFINVKDLAGAGDRENLRAGDFLREGYYTYELKKTADLMEEMRANAVAMAFVLDEYGLTVGMITLEDLLEEIVGEIRDEYDEDEKEFIKKIGENMYLVEGGMKIDDINDALGLCLASEEYDSLGGLMIEPLSRLPEDGEAVTVAGGVILQAKGVDRNRIHKVLLTLPAADKAGAETAEAESGSQ